MQSSLLDDIYEENTYFLETPTEEHPDAKFFYNLNKTILSNIPQEKLASFKKLSKFGLLEFPNCEKSNNKFV
jgi:hypothetical protein